MRWMLAALTLAGCAEMDGPRRVWSTLDGKPPLVIAHRGASGDRPEHTLEAYALAIDMGADVIEPDLVFTKDGVPVARHDRYLSTTTDISDHPEFAGRRRANDDAADIENRGRADWWAEDFTLAELKTLRARQPFPGRSKEFDGLYEIPAFDEILALVASKAKKAGRPIGVYPETKHPGFYLHKGYDFEEPLLTALERFDAGPVFIQSFEPEILKRLKGKTNAKLVQLVYEKDPGAGSNIALEEIAKYADGVGAAKGLVLPGSAGREDFLERSHRLGLFVHPWTFRTDQPNEKIGLLVKMVVSAAGKEPSDSADDAAATRAARILTRGLSDAAYAEAELQAFLEAGADGVFTDFPDAAVAVRAKMHAERRE